MTLKPGDTFIAQRSGGIGNSAIGATREFTVVRVTPKGWVKADSRVLTRPNGSTVKLREIATFKPDGRGYSTRRRSDGFYGSYWWAEIKDERV